MVTTANINEVRSDTLDEFEGKEFSLDNFQLFTEGLALTDAQTESTFNALEDQGIMNFDTAFTALDTDNSYTLTSKEVIDGCGNCQADGVSADGVSGAELTQMLKDRSRKGDALTIEDKNNVISEYEESEGALSNTLSEGDIAYLYEINMFKGLDTLQYDDQFLDAKGNPLRDASGNVITLDEFGNLITLDREGIPVMDGEGKVKIYNDANPLKYGENDTLTLNDDGNLVSSDGSTEFTHHVNDKDPAQEAFKLIVDMYANDSDFRDLLQFYIDENHVGPTITMGELAGSNGSSLFGVGSVGGTESIIDITNILHNPKRAKETIAHELMHNLGETHDNEDEEALFDTELSSMFDNSYNGGSEAYSWSDYAANSEGFPDVTASLVGEVEVSEESDESSDDDTSDETPDDDTSD